MEDAVVEARRRAYKDTARIVISIVLMLMLVWIVHTGYKLATETRTDTETNHGCEDGYVALVFGVVTVSFGLVYLIIGLTMVGEIALDFWAWLQQEEKEQKTICRVFIQATATMVSVFMLTWTIYNGYQLAAEAQKGGVYNRLAFLVGFITMAFGFTYFIIGFAIITDSALYLTGRLQDQDTESDIHQDRTSDAYFAV